MRQYYILNEHGDPVAVDDVQEWAEWFEENHKTGIPKRRVAYDEVLGLRVSTVFLGMNMAWCGEEPMLFETMIFPKKISNDLYCERYASRAEAEAGHARAKRAVPLIILKSLWNWVKHPIQSYNAYRDWGTVFV
jgi:hypothetical protein